MTSLLLYNKVGRYSMRMVIFIFIIRLEEYVYGISLRLGGIVCIVLYGTCMVYLYLYIKVGRYSMCMLTDYSNPDCQFRFTSELA